MKNLHLFWIGLKDAVAKNKSLIAMLVGIPLATIVSAYFPLVVVGLLLIMAISLLIYAAIDSLINRGRKIEREKEEMTKLDGRTPVQYQ